MTTDWRLYEGTARVFRPHPWEEMETGVLWTLSTFGWPHEFVVNLAGLRSAGSAYDKNSEPNACDSSFFDSEVNAFLM